MIDDLKIMLSIEHYSFEFEYSLLYYQQRRKDKYWYYFEIIFIVLIMFVCISVHFINIINIILGHYYYTYINIIIR